MSWFHWIALLVCWGLVEWRIRTARKIGKLLDERAAGLEAIKQILDERGRELVREGIEEAWRELARRQPRVRN